MDFVVRGTPLLRRFPLLGIVGFVVGVRLALVTSLGGARVITCFDDLVVTLWSPLARGFRVRFGFLGCVEVDLALSAVVAIKFVRVSSFFSVGREILNEREGVSRSFVIPAVTASFCRARKLLPSAFLSFLSSHRL